MALKRIWIAVGLAIQFEFWQGQRQIPSSFFSPACSQLLCEAWQSKVDPKAVAWVALKRIWIAVGLAIQFEFWQGQRQIPSSFFSPACSQLLCEPADQS